MALSNWATLALDAKGNPSPGAFTSPLGITAQIYKGWIYLKSAEMWQEGGSYVSPVISQVSEGELVIGDLHLIARRAPAAYERMIAPAYERMIAPQEGIYLAAWHQRYLQEERKYQITGMLGLGVYGYDDDKWMGVKTASLDFLRAFLVNSNAPAELKFLDWTDEDWQERAQHFNQGDAFFSGHFGVETPQHPVGEKDEPMIMDAIQSLKPPE